MYQSVNHYENEAWQFYVIYTLTVLHQKFFVVEEFFLLLDKVGVCGAHLYQEVCLASGHKVAKEGVSQTPPLLLRLFTHPYTPSLATTVAITLLTDIRE